MSTFWAADASRYKRLTYEAMVSKHNLQQRASRSSVPRLQVYGHIRTAIQHLIPNTHQEFQKHIRISEYGTSPHVQNPTQPARMSQFSLSLQPVL